MDVQDQTAQRRTRPTPKAAAEPEAVEAPETVEAPEAVEEWPPRAWRETTRSAGHRQAGLVALAMLAMFAVLVFLAIWASHNG